jgi:hypothetical protein
MKESKTPLPVTIAIVTIITIICWIVFGVVRVVTKHEGPNIPQEITEPINPTLDTDVLSAVSQSVYLNDDQIGQLKPVASSPTSRAVASPSAQVRPTSQASPSGTLTP